MTEDQLKEMKIWLDERYHPDLDNAYNRQIAEKAFRAGFDLAQKPLALDRAIRNLDFLLRSGAYAGKKK